MHHFKTFIFTSTISNRQIGILQITMFELVDTVRFEVMQQLDPEHRANLGQYMTSNSIAKFMASLLNISQHDISLLDAGAGMGSLTIAVLNRLNKTQKSQITAYEVDIKLYEHLKDNINLSKKLLGSDFSSTVLNCDFIEDSVSKLKSKKCKKYSHVILNPPYKKINSSSLHRLLLRDVGIETGNLYSAFIALSLLQLKKGGELVAIVPRSFCNGTQFKQFRKFINNSAAIRQIHLFDSRDKAFKSDAVLQENIIIHLIKSGEQGDVVISTSTDDKFDNYIENTYPFSKIVYPTDSEYFIHIPHQFHCDSIDRRKVKSSLDALNLFVSTGPVVDFRISERDLSFNIPKGFVPLLHPAHFNGKGFKWPQNVNKANSIKVNEYTKGLLYPIGYYVIIRRFSSKEQNRRIIARVFDPNSFQFEYIGIENHLNVIHTGKKGIEKDLAYGLAAYLNSTFVDKTFRNFNGHTQVNATDLRQLKYPNKEKLIELGKYVQNLDNFDPVEIDNKLNNILK